MITSVVNVWLICMASKWTFIHSSLHLPTSIKKPLWCHKALVFKFSIKFQTFLLVKIDHIHGMLNVLFLGAQKSFDNECQVTDCPEVKWRAKSRIQFNSAISTKMPGGTWTVWHCVSLSCYSEGNISIYSLQICDFNLSVGGMKDILNENETMRN